MRYIVLILLIVFVFGLATIGVVYIPKIKDKQKTTQKKDKGNTKGLVGDKDQLAIIFSSIEDGLVLIDGNGAIVLFNQSAGVMTGWDVNDTIGISVNMVIKLADDKGNLYTGPSYAFNKAFTSGQTVRENNDFLVTRDNKKIAVSVSVSPLKDEAGKVTGAVALIGNITQEKEQEGRLADFISTASHEMRTPVAAIEGYLALALNDKVATVDYKAREYLEKAQEATKHLGTLFQDLLTSAKAEDGRLASHPQVIEIGEMLKNLTEDLKFIAEKHGLETEFIIGSSPLVKTASQQQGGERQIAPLYYAYVDPDRLREVITNLYDNAVKYTPEGKISIGLTGNDDVIQFYVKDTGTGIPREDLPHLFQKFYRVDNSATRTIGGNGLGLFICRKIIELYSGRIWVESEVGKGSTFYINLPRLSTKKATDMLKEEANATTIAPTTNTQAIS
ncbi:MAG: sensor histidine kinase [Candidatus Saccharimonadales bacterium]